VDVLVSREVWNGDHVPVIHSVTVDESDVGEFIEQLVGIDVVDWEHREFDAPRVIDEAAFAVGEGPEADEE
jgi:hypothetical protein